MFPHPDDVREMQKELDGLIQLGVFNITKLIKSQEAKALGSMPDLDGIDDPKGQDINPILAHAEDHDTRVINNAKKLSFKTMFLNAKKRMKVNTAFDSRLAPTEDEKQYDNHSPNKESIVAGIFHQSKDGSKTTEQDSDSKPVKFSHRKPLTEQLLEQGILTEEMLKRIQKELSENNDSKDEE